MRYDDGWAMHDGGSGWLMGIVGLMALLLLIALIAWVVVMLVRGSHVVSGGAPAVQRRDAPGAEAILDERLARGEIDPEEYATRLRALRDSR